MTLDLSVVELKPPQLQFGGAGTSPEPKGGLHAAGPFDLRFGSARSDAINVGLVGPGDMIDDTLKWLARCESEIPALVPNSLLRRAFPGFSAIYRKKIVVSDLMTIRLDSETRDPLAEAMRLEDPFAQFKRVVDLYGEAHQRLALREVNRPDVVLVCLPKSIRDQIGTIARETTDTTSATAKKIREAKASRQQLDFFDMLDEVEETEDDFLKRDLRHALKARALKNRLPIQIVTPKLIYETGLSEDPATRAWNFSVGLYYKAGGVPWRVQPAGPPTCFVGVSFHHFHTSRRHIVQASLAHAFSSDGEGFAIRGSGVPAEQDQRLNVHLSEMQAFDLGERILREYTARTGAAPLRVVIHKSSLFDDAELAGFQSALRDTPIISLVTMTPSAFRLLRFGPYPPKVGTICTINDARTFLYTSGFVPELDTYPGSHVPQPVEVRSVGEEADVAAADIFGLTRMNWNSADLRGKWPVTLSFARRVGGILNEYGDEDPAETSFRYFV